MYPLGCSERASAMGELVFRRLWFKELCKGTMAFAWLPLALVTWDSSHHRRVAGAVVIRGDGRPRLVDQQPLVVDAVHEGTCVTQITTLDGLEAVASPGFITPAGRSLVAWLLVEAASRA